MDGVYGLLLEQYQHQERQQAEASPMAAVRQQTPVRRQSPRLRHAEQMVGFKSIKPAYLLVSPVSLSMDTKQAARRCHVHLPVQAPPQPHMGEWWKTDGAAANPTRPRADDAALTAVQRSNRRSSLVPARQPAGPRSSSAAETVPAASEQSGLAANLAPAAAAPAPDKRAAKAAATKAQAPDKPAAADKAAGPSPTVSAASSNAGLGRPKVDGKFLAQSVAVETSCKPDRHA